MNLYAYVGNNPLNWIDPYGLYPKPRDRHSSADCAACAALDLIERPSVDEDREYAGWIWEREDGSYSFTQPRRGSRHRSHPGGKRKESYRGAYHSHGKESGPKYRDEEFGPQDTRMLNDWKVDGYLVTPSGMRLKYVYNPEGSGSTPIPLNCDQCKKDEQDKKDDKSDKDS
jgi:hypothetical protein